MRSLGTMFVGKEGIGLLIMRIVLGIIFLGYGLSKLGNLAGVQGMFDKHHIPLAAVLAPFVALVEVIGGIALICIRGREMSPLWQ